MPQTSRRRLYNKPAVDDVDDGAPAAEAQDDIVLFASVHDVFCWFGLARDCFTAVETAFKFTDCHCGPSHPPNQMRWQMHSAHREQREARTHTRVCVNEWMNECTHGTVDVTVQAAARGPSRLEGLSHVYNVLSFLDRLKDSEPEMGMNACRTSRSARSNRDKNMKHDRRTVCGLAPDTRVPNGHRESTWWFKLRSQTVLEIREPPAHADSHDQRPLEIRTQMPGPHTRCVAGAGGTPGRTHARGRFQKARGRP